MSTPPDLQTILTTTALRDLALKECVFLEAAQTIAQAVAQMKSEDRGSGIVCDEGTLVGIFTERDFLRLLHQQVDLNSALSEVMTKSPATVTLSTALAEALAMMNKGRYRRLPVVDENGKPVGMVDVKSITGFLVEHYPQAVYNQAPHDSVIAKNREGA